MDALTSNKTIIYNTLVTIFASVITYLDQFNSIIRACSGVIGVIVGVLTILKILKDLKK
jgi:hypothetical protein